MQTTIIILLLILIIVLLIYNAKPFKIQIIGEALWKTLMVILFSCFPVLAIILINLTSKKGILNNIDYALLISSVYSILTPTIVNLIYGKIKSSIQTFFLLAVTLTVVTLMTAAVTLTPNITFAGNNLWILLVAAIASWWILFLNIYQEQVEEFTNKSAKNFSDNEIETADEIQNELKLQSQNIGNEDE